MNNELEINRFTNFFDRLCTVTVCLNNKQKEIEDIRSLIRNLSSLYPSLIINVHKYNMHLLVLQKDAKNLYDEYVALNKKFTSFIENADERLIYSCVIRITDKEHDLKNEIIKDRALGIPDESISFITDLANVYYQYIESIHFILNERNELKLKLKKPI